jgi:hypothetical protein
MNLADLDLNFYSNKLGEKGALDVANAISTQKSLKSLSLDFYFNNITETGTEFICNAISTMNNK